MIIKNETVVDMAYSQKVKRYTTWDTDTEFIQLCKYQSFADKFTEQHGLPYIRITFNGKLKKCLGRYTVGRNKEFIQISKAYAIADYRLGNDYMKRVLIHELTHYQLKVQGKHFNDGDRDFEEALRVNGGSSSGATKEGLRLTDIPSHYYSMYDVYQAVSKLTGDIVSKRVLHPHTAKQAYQSSNYCVKGVPVELSRIGFQVHEVIAK